MELTYKYFRSFNSSKIYNSDSDTSIPSINNLYKFSNISIPDKSYNGFWFKFRLFNFWFVSLSSIYSIRFWLKSNSSKLYNYSKKSREFNLLLERFKLFNLFKKSIYSHLLILLKLKSIYSIFEIYSKFYTISIRLLYKYNLVRFGIETKFSINFILFLERSRILSSSSPSIKGITQSYFSDKLTKSGFIYLD